ncbi:MAG: hypothetical protein LJE70_07045, partial [Chromatiaceae bacterium]|nr:hypothetical protein [Chromatiaceae bacterium]
MPLNTRCRHCGRLFPVYAQQIKERKGKVDCPQCGKRFDAIGGLLDESIPAVQTRAMGTGVVSGLPPATSASASADLMDFGEEGAAKGRLQTALW